LPPQPHSNTKERRKEGSAPNRTEGARAHNVFARKENETDFASDCTIEIVIGVGSDLIPHRQIRSAKLSTVFYLLAQLKLSGRRTLLQIKYRHFQMTRILF
jgi:hypothetical protein